MQQRTELIHSNWQFKQADHRQWMPASVPGEVHMDLLHNEIIEEPFYRLNERNQQWVGQVDWEYRTHFDVDENLLEFDHLELVFEGLDTYADVYLNGVEIFSANNMFRTWVSEIKAHLQPGQNELRVYFHNVFKVNKPKWRRAPFRLMAVPTNDQSDIQLTPYTRKAGYHFGWDWGPRLVTAGMWRPVKLKGWNAAKIDGLHIIQNAVSEDKADLTARFEITSDREQNVELHLTIDEERVVRQQVELNEGSNHFALPYTLEDPKLWWTRNLGGQPLYTFTGSLEKEGQVLDASTHRIGIRSIEVVREPDIFGQSFFIRLNGVPVFMKGANYIPMDSFQSRVTPARHRRLIDDAVQANMNMLRVWGGGIYEDDHFYDLCDENGLLVWQDMMFACAMYPADENFLENVACEVRDNVRRLRNHPSIALYCGNNEVEMIWHLMWEEQFPPDIRRQFESDMKALFHQTIPNAIRQVDSTRYYLPTSPDSGYDNRPASDGNLHYWKVWHGKAHFSSYDDHIGRFMTEYGFQAYPDYSTIQKFTEPDERHLHSAVMHSHQRCTADNRRDLEYANRLITHYMQRHYHVPDEFRDFIYVNQVMQAEGVGRAVEAHRRHKANHHCMGTLYWQINDCWPVASWSSTDYYGRWKALQYKVRKLYNDLILSVISSGGQLRVYVVSDRLEVVRDAELQLSLIDFNGGVCGEETRKITIPANTSRLVYDEKLGNWLDGKQQSAVVLEAELQIDGGNAYRALHYFSEVRELNLPNAKPDIKIQKNRSEFTLTVRSDKLLKNVFLEHPGGGHFSNNYFDLLPCESQTITYTPERELKLAEFRKNLKVKSMADTSGAAVPAGFKS